MNLKHVYRYFTSLGTGLLALTLLVTLVAAASQTDILGPAGSSLFGTSVTALPNGNLVVTDPDYDAGSNVDVGAVYLYGGETGLLISTLTGSSADDHIGSSGVIVLANGNFVVSSTSWDSSGLMDAGAVTWGSGESGVSGVVSAANSLVGSTANDRVGSPGVTALASGNYLVRSVDWDNGGMVDAGAVTWGSGTAGVIGVVSAANSLVGSTANDMVGNSVTVLANGNYVVNSPAWDSSGLLNAGAVTWGSGVSGVGGGISAANSLVGSTANDQVGAYGVAALANGNYVVSSANWDDGATTNVGAVTWGSGEGGIRGAVSAANSLVGSVANDRVGSLGVTALANSNYVVRSQYWDNGAMTDAGAVTWGSGTAGFIGVVSPANSLVGSRPNDNISSSGVTALANGNYVVISPEADNGGLMDAGAVTWGSGISGVSGLVSAANSLVGSTANDRAGTLVTALANGNYVVSSLEWHNGATTNAGAVTWGSGEGGISGGISAANSLVGSTANDYVGVATPLVNGNYVVNSRYWDNGAMTDAGAATWGSGTSGVSGGISAANSLVGSTVNDSIDSFVSALVNGNYVVVRRNWDTGAVTDAGAVTWGSGTMGVSGVVSAANSLVGSTASDWVGSGVTALANGNYVVSSPHWDNGAMTEAGAVTWSSGIAGVSGGISAVNSLVGSTVNDQVGAYGVTALANGNYVVSSLVWDNDAVTNAGAVTWSGGGSGAKGPITTDNSVLGETTGGGTMMNWVYDQANQQLVVGRPADNIVTLFRIEPQRLFLPIMVR